MNTRNIPVMVVLLALSCSASGCAVGMALSGRKDPDVGGLAVGQDRAVVMATLGQPHKTYGTIGERVDVFKLKRGDEPSAGRAIAHGVMDVLTLCLWEVVGTPIEATQGEAFYLTVQYDPEDKITRMIPGDDGTALASLQRAKPREQNAVATANESDADSETRVR
jgi:hypothetical protein